MSSSASITPDMSVVALGKEKAVSANLRELITAEVSTRSARVLPGLAASTQIIEVSTQHTVDQLWPVQKSFGPIQIRGHKGTGLYVFDTHSKTVTGSPVADVLDAAQDQSGNTYVFVYGNVLGGQNDDRYAWVSTRDGSVLSGTINDEPVRGLPTGLVALAA